MKIGFIGTGFIGGNMSNNFIKRGYEVIQYSLEEKYIGNKDRLKECEYVFVAVPTPTINRKFDGSILDNAIENTYPGQKIIIKSTIIVGTTDKLQNKYLDRYFFHSAEFLTERNAENDVDNPTRNIIGETEISQGLGQSIIDILPQSPHNIICKAKESELGKYMANFLLSTKIIMSNIIYDISDKESVDYEKVKEIATTDPRIGQSHTNVIFEGGRGSGGHCFVKDTATVHEMYPKKKESGNQLLDRLEQYNLELLYNSNKSIEIINQVYGLIDSTGDTH